MTRPSPATAPRHRGWRWLLVLAVLTGMGLWPGTHCADVAATSGHVDAHVGVHVPDTAPRSTLAVNAAARLGLAPATPAAEDCHVPPIAAVSAVSSVTVARPAGGSLTPCAPWRPTAPVLRAAVAPALIQIGVSRT